MTLNPDMIPIQTVTVPSGGQPSIIFNNIPQTYTDLVILLSARTDRTGANIDGVYPFFNNDTIVGNYSGRRIIGNGSTATSNTYTGVITAANDLTTYAFGNAIIYIPNYRSANNKSFTVDAVNENNATIAYTTLSALLWNNTAPISTITLRTEDGVSKLLQHSTATLYGITSAGYGAYATGGVITSDASYYYHTFFASGTFTPSQNLTADYLVVAGGGGGGPAYGGGGGAGGLKCTIGATGGGGSLPSALSLTASTGYTVTIGAGGGGGVWSATSPSTTKGSNGSNSVFSSITSTGGGGGGVGDGGYGSSIRTGNNGGSGGGSAYGISTAGAGAANEGRDGGIGSAVSPNYNSGGGGGAGAVGATPTLTAQANGGNGVQTSISGTSTYYAGGGAGGGGGTTAGTGGLGGGGNGSLSGNGTAGTVNTGGGGSGGYNFTEGAAGGAGGSGIVIIRYAK